MGHSGRLCRFELRQVCCRCCHLRYLLNWVRSLQQPLLRRNSAFVDPSRVGSPDRRQWRHSGRLCRFELRQVCCRRCHLHYLLNWVQQLFTKQPLLSMVRFTWSLCSPGLPGQYNANARHFDPSRAVPVSYCIKCPATAATCCMPAQLGSLSTNNLC